MKSGTPPSSSESDTSSARSERARSLATLHLAAVTQSTGILLILPALPLMRQELGLSDGGLAWLVSIYALPGLVAAIPLGVLADRVGRHRVISLALLAFGLAAVPQVLFPTFNVILIGRFVQGTAAAAIMPLSMVIISDISHGGALVRAQGGRTISLKAGAALLPMLGGVLVGIAWYAPFGFQTISIFVALIAWRMVPRLPSRTDSTRAVFVSLAKLARNPAAVALQLLGLVRFLVRRGYLTYFPFLVAERGMSVAAIGIVLGVTEGLGALAAFGAGRMVGRWSAPSLFTTSILISTGALILLGISESLIIIAVASIVFGTVDGVFGVIHNSLLVLATSADIRGSFVALSFLSKNLGRFLGPIAVAAVVVWTSLMGAFIAMAGAMLLLVVSVPICAPVFSRLESQLES